MPLLGAWTNLLPPLLGRSPVAIVRYYRYLCVPLVQVMPGHHS